MKHRYLDIMEKVLDVYAPERIDAYIRKASINGITEHGFPRLCANIGILIAHGRAMRLKPCFEVMMDICCRDIPNSEDIRGRRGNDFSVREILSCILELEKAKLYSAETISRWKDAMAAVDPYKCYRMIAPNPPVPADNWAAFNAAGEQLRCAAGLAHTHEYIENQIASQLFSFDENGMYRDPNEPMVYDLVGRNMLMTCLFYGYNGKHKDILLSHFEKAAELTLQMQSVTGEIPYGGRSNQFIHNEAHIAANMEFMSNHYQHTGRQETASRCKAAANLALNCIERWLREVPGHHVKNCYPVDSMFGCEEYAYYDKYMITVASFLYLAYEFCDESIEPTACPATQDSAYAVQTSHAFRKLFLRSGPYFLEAEVMSDRHYDAEGIGRIHRKDAPSVICISDPAPISPVYLPDGTNSFPLSICCGKNAEGSWIYGFDQGVVSTFESHTADKESAEGVLRYLLPNGDTLVQSVSLSKNGTVMDVYGTGTVTLTLPAFHFDGMHHSQITHTENKVSVLYKNWICTYSSRSTIEDMNTVSCNRNGAYKIFRALDKDHIQVRITIEPAV